MFKVSNMSFAPRSGQVNNRPRELDGKDTCSVKLPGRPSISIAKQLSFRVHYLPDLNLGC